MTALRLIPLALLAALALTACDTASENRQDKAAAAQRDANEKIHDASAEAAQKMRDAQAEANVKIAAADADFVRARADYRHTMTTDLAKLDEQVAALKAKALKANGEAKRTLEASIADIEGYHKTFLNDYTTIDNGNAAGWPETRARLDREWKELRASVDRS